VSVQIGDVVKVEYIITDEEGIKLYDSSEISNKGPIKIQIGYGQVFKAFEDAIIGMELGESKEIILSPEQGFGEIDTLLFEKIPKSQFPNEEEMVIGKQIEYVGLNGMSSPARIRLIEDDHVIIDMNPPLAGKIIKLYIKLIETGLDADSVQNPFYVGMSCNGECNHDNHSLQKRI
jgi:FKBP-type peptidyl-prolyl cis-trans isomerase 2